MCPKAKEIWAEQRKIIRSLGDECKSYGEIIRIIGKTHSSVLQVVQNFIFTNFLWSKLRSGGLSKPTEREKQTIRASAESWKRHYKIRSNVKEYFGEEKRKRSMDLANLYIYKLSKFLERVLFSEERKFCTFDIKGRKFCLALNKENLVPTLKHGEGCIMVWRYMQRFRQYCIY